MESKILSRLDELFRELRVFQRNTKVLDVEAFAVADRMEKTAKARATVSAPKKAVSSIRPSPPMSELAFYQTSAELVEGEPAREWPEIPGNSSVTHRYKVSLKREGIYTLTSALVTYNHTCRTFFARSNYAYVTVRPPTLIDVIAAGVPEAWNLTVDMLDTITGVRGGGQVLLTARVLVIVAVIAFFGYKDYKKWRGESAGGIRWWEKTA